MKTKPLYQKLIPPTITTVILVSLVILSTDPIMAFILNATIAFNAWIMVMVIQDHFYEHEASKQITVASHQELRHYAGDAVVAFNSTLCSYYHRVPHDTNNPVMYTDNGNTVIVGFYAWTRQPSKDIAIIRNKVKGDSNVVTNNVSSNRYSTSAGFDHLYR